MSQILLVDDDPNIRKLLSLILRNKFSASVEEAQNGKDALEKLQQIKPVLIISDVMMPEMNGVEFISQLRKIEEFKNTPVIVLTSLSDKILVEKLLKLEIIDFILKPIDYTKTVIRLDKILSKIDPNLRLDKVVN